MRKIYFVLISWFLVFQAGQSFGVFWDWDFDDEAIEEELQNRTKTRLDEVNSCMVECNEADLTSSNVPLQLTPLLMNSTKLKSTPEVWRELAVVRNFSNILSYSGYLTVNEQWGSNLFFWFFPAAYNAETAPLLLWLNGGPGTSSLFGLFVENGPFYVDNDGFLRYRKNPWTLSHSMLYLDSPVGTGFSFTQSEEGYARNQEDVSRDVYEALVQFFTVFPEYLSRDFYVAGQSYAGKYAPAVAMKIIKENNRRGASIRLNLKGIIVGSGFTDPLTQNEYGEFLYNMGLIDELDALYFKDVEDRVRTYIHFQNWRQATETIQSLMLGSSSHNKSYFENLTHFRFYMNVLQTTVPETFKTYSEFLGRDNIRRALHVGDQRFIRNSRSVMGYMFQDICKSMKGAVERLLDENYRVLIYAPQLDIIVPHTGVDRYVKSLRWHGSQQFLETRRRVWRVNGEIAGYSKATGGLNHILLRNAGHIAGHDQPEWVFEMVTRLTRGLPF